MKRKIILLTQHSLEHYSPAVVLKSSRAVLAYVIKMFLKEKREYIVQAKSIIRAGLKKSAIALSISALLVSGTLQAEPLGELLPNLLENHDKIKAAKADLESAGFSTRQANAAWYPSITLTAKRG